jgi:hypothetical protein
VPVDIEVSMVFRLWITLTYLLAVHLDDVSYEGAKGRKVASSLVRPVLSSSCCGSSMAPTIFYVPVSYNEGTKRGNG